MKLDLNQMTNSEMFIMHVHDWIISWDTGKFNKYNMDYSSGGRLSMPGVCTVALQMVCFPTLKVTARMKIQPVATLPIYQPKIVEMGFESQGSPMRGTTVSRK